MDIATTQSIHSLHGTQKLQGPHRMTGTDAGTRESSAIPAQPQQPIRDEIRFSAESLQINSANQSETSSAGVRFDLVNRIKAEIASGTYDTPDKMDIALSRMLAK